MGCLVLSRLAAEVKRALKIDLDEKFWCDSTTALSWIKTSATEFKPIASVRVIEIQQSQPNAAWNYITSEANPADALTRGITPDELQLWHNRPQFLQKPESEWPDFKRCTVTSKSQLNPEKKNKSKIKIDLQLTQSNISVIDAGGVNKGRVVGNNEDTQEILNRILTGSSTFRKARRVTALVVRTLSRRKILEDRSLFLNCKMLKND